MKAQYLHRRPAMGRMKGPDEWRTCILVRKEAKRERVVEDGGVPFERITEGYVIRVNEREKWVAAVHVK